MLVGYRMNFKFKQFLDIMNIDLILLRGRETIAERSFNTTLKYYK